MRVAEELRKHADLAIKEGGMYYSGEYLGAIARRAESEQAENAKLRTQLADVTVSMGRAEERCAKLRELCRDMYLVVELLDMDGVLLQAHGKDADWRTLKERFDELMEVDG